MSETLYLIKHKFNSKYLKGLGFIDDGVHYALSFTKKKAKEIIRKSNSPLIYIKASAIPTVEIKSWVGDGLEWSDYRKYIYNQGRI